LLVSNLASCASFTPRRAAKGALILVGGGMVAGSVVVAGDYTQIMNNDTSKLLAAMGGTFLIFGLIAFCLDITLSSKDILGGFQ
jgi:hypothetical protein